MNSIFKIVLLMAGGALISYVSTFVFHLPVIVGWILAGIYGWKFDWFIGDK